MRTVLVTLLTLLCLCASSSSASASPGRRSPSRHSGAAQSATQQQGDVRSLELGKPIERELRGGESHVYRIRLEAGQFLHLVVQKKGIDAIGALIGPDGEMIALTGRPNGSFGPEPLSAIATASGDHAFRVLPVNQGAPAGDYEIKITDLRLPQPQDATRIAAERTFVDAMQFWLRGTADSRRTAIARFDEALPLWQAVGDHYEEATTLNMIGRVYDALGEKQKALDYYNQALPLRRAVGDRSGEAATLSNIGVVYDTLGEKRKALDFYGQALPLKRAVRDRSGEAITLNNIGLVYKALGEERKALSNFTEVLPLVRAVGDRAAEATTLNNIGAVYDDLGEKQKALDFYNQALPLLRAVGNRSGEATTLHNIGKVHDDLGEKQKALGFYNQALPIYRAVGDRAGEAGTLNNLGKVYSGMGEKQKALDDYNQALPLLRAVGNRFGEAATLSNMGAVYDDLGQKQKALDYYNQALPLRRAVGDRTGEAITLNNVGWVYATLGEKQKALEHYNRALALERSVKDPLMEGATLGLLMAYWQGEKKPPLAIFFGKQAINSFQQIRRNIQGLEKTTKQSFATSVEGAYRRLADLLVSEGRLFEAQQVLGLLKEEEFKEFTRDDKSGGAAGTLALTSTETALDRRYREVSGGTAALWSDWDSLNSKSPRTPEEEQRFQSLSKQLSDAQQAFQTFISQELYEELGGRADKQADSTVRELEQKTSDLQAVLHDLDPGTVALYTVAAPERLIIIMVLPDARIARDYPIKPEALREKVFALRRMLLSPESDPLPLAQELYKILLGPVEKDLQAAGAKTLMWSLDDVLRYIPIAALHDGKHYVVEKYRNEIFTLSSISKLKDPLRPGSWKVLAMGVSKSYGGFSPLPTVPSELHGIVRAAGDAPGGLMPGVMLMDDAFTKEAFEAALRQGFPVVHVASHFSFQTSGDDFSFLLLGGKDQAGAHLTLADIKTDVNIRFWNTELLTLSACQSALSGERNGRELDGLGEIAQRKGAKAVIASLWSVSDRSTGALMRKFYEIWTTHPGMPKAEALRQAQLSLLREDVKPDPVVAAPGEPSPPNSFAHPYYWAPFILIGNWR